MACFNLEEVTAALEQTRVSPSGVSFEGKSLKLDSEEDAKPVVEAIDSCTELQYLNLEGNTLGVDACKAVAKALENHPEFKKALWKDMFTGRMKTEIPKALEYLGAGLVTAGAQLTELDMSDNAFGPVGVEGLAALLRSSSCYALEELRLNNNGLGVTGGKLLAGALMECYSCSKQQGNVLALKVFVAGRNRLENEGAVALAKVFKTIGTLEEISMPQNGIYHHGITALADAFTHNPNLQIINLNDNTIGPKGANSIAKALPSLQSLKNINFGDCLLKTKGAKLLAVGLKPGHQDLEELILDANEINTDGGVQLVKAMDNKCSLRSIVLDSNQFGEKGRAKLRQQLKEIGKLNTLGSLNDDESGDSDEDEESSSDESEDEKDPNLPDLEETITTEGNGVASVQDFIDKPTAEKFLALGDSRVDLILKEAEKSPDTYFDSILPILMKISALCVSKQDRVACGSLSCCQQLYREVFTWARDNEKNSVLNNSLLVHLGMIKSEDKKCKPTWNLEGCLLALESVLHQNYIPEATKDTLKVFMGRQVVDADTNMIIP